MSDATAAFAASISRICAARRITGRQLSGLAATSPGTITRAMNGDGDGISLAVAGRIAAALGVQLHQLLGAAACPVCLDTPPPGFTCNSCERATPAGPDAIEAGDSDA